MWGKTRSGFAVNRQLSRRLRLYFMSYGSGSVDGQTLTGLIQVRGSFAAPSTGPVSRRGAHVPGRVPASRAEPDFQVT